eukprot:TRINITY_DN13353_c0_g1_i1.p1 TRINITY_DN13353_c0_g1~~TRINITY_DN13353_c0_g1_i1.p1  ORF type:complete len:189 (+),score=40.64 TRINITY_DN13353_c0_g1_i1:108-674(+)
MSLKLAVCLNAAALVGVASAVRVTRHNSTHASEELDMALDKLSAEVRMGVVGVTDPCSKCMTSDCAPDKHGVFEEGSLEEKADASKAMYACGRTKCAPAGKCTATELDDAETFYMNDFLPYPHCDSCLKTSCGVKLSLREDLLKNGPEKAEEQLREAYMKCAPEKCKCSTKYLENYLDFYTSKLLPLM